MEDPTKYRLTHHVTRETIENWLIDPTREVVMAVHTPWWSLWEDLWLPYRTKEGIPTDPRGSVLMQGKLSKFWTQALANPGHYGKHGIDALIAAFHTNVEVLTEDRGWRPTSLDSWYDYNKLIDLELASKNESQA